MKNLLLKHQVEKDKELDKERFTFGDKIEGTPTFQGIEMAKSVREPNFLRLNRADDDDIEIKKPAKIKEKIEVI
jgi:hypothetical protein